MKRCYTKRDEGDRSAESMKMCRPEIVLNLNRLPEKSHFKYCTWGIVVQFMKPNIKRYFDYGNVFDSE